MKPRTIGDLHVIGVKKELDRYLKSGSFSATDSLEGMTANYIVRMFRGINNVCSKFEFHNSNDMPDLLINVLDKAEPININLYKIRDNRRIQPKNPGAKSFLSKYFLSDELQGKFNEQFEVLYLEFINEIICEGGIKNRSYDIKDMRKLIREQYRSFTPEFEKYRKKFLFNIREYCFELLANEYNAGSSGILNALKELLHLDEINIITRYNDLDELIAIEQFNPVIQSSESYKLTKRSHNSIGIETKDITLLIRFKFESGPASSVKLATSYEKTVIESEVISDNRESVREFEKLIEKHFEANIQESSPNSIGKCNEAIFYYSLIKQNYSIRQAESNFYIKMFSVYSEKLSSRISRKLLIAATNTVTGILSSLENKYNNLFIESAQLIPDAYIDDKLDNADLSMIIKANGKYFTERISLKALKKNSGRYVVKNPGIGSILGPLYFDKEPLTPLVAEFKEDYHNSKIDLMEVQEELSAELADRLLDSTQGELIKGIKALLGSSLVVISFYSDDAYLVMEHKESIKYINVKKQTPTKIQTTLEWEDGEKAITLRVKFSKGKDHGWSTLKLACTCKYSRDEVVYY